jgi:isopenicillin N synthase-like dioxygenase
MKLPLHGPNLFPDEKTYPNFKEVMTTYHSKMCDLAHQVAQLFADAASASGAFAFEGTFDK